ncbi:hypothetical protein FPV58_28790 [Mycolicibacterium porcinum]|uniref:hypothetical protein n=1 Tax=Mycolicibacterium porcinum TaxID=39693 RepID=UPI001196C8CC|nr:hypothetical protein [Mycolicibacterium porcinum]TVX95172.1 hypothetical protein FPV58_28790 [Mycolicibacterium porcinum]
MTSVVRVMDRLVTAVVALVLLAAGGWLIAYRLDLRVARVSAERLQPGVLTRTSEWAWWPAVLGGAGVVAVVLGLWLLLLHLRPTAVRTVDGDAGAVNLDRIADAVAADVGRHPVVQGAKASTRIERGRPVMCITVQVSQDTPTAEVRRLARRCAADAQRAAGAGFEFQLLVKHVRPEKMRPKVI